MYAPGEETCLRTDATQPGERCCATIADTQVRQAAKSGTDQNGGDGSTLTVDVCQEAGRLSLKSQGIQRSG
jgi:hypothetical protein